MAETQDILTTMSSAFNVTLFPTNFIELDRDARMDYYSLLKIQTILKHEMSMVTKFLKWLEII